ncbi:MAG: DUF6506 family protein [Aquihabitans sp.]
MQKWAFIYTLSAESTEPRQDDIGDDGCRLIAVGVPSPSDAAAVIEDLVAAGVELIECCGAFGPKESAAVLDAVGNRVPVGFVTYPCSEATGLHQLFGS